jgi:homoserine dehydrogenase
MTGKPMRIGMAGLGTVGQGVIRLLEANADTIAQRAGRPIELVAVSARDRQRQRNVSLATFDWFDDPRSLAARSGIDAVVELIGGSEGPALDLARQALSQGRGLVTANKAMIALHGMELAGLAEENGAPLRFEAAVGGGIPVLKGLREGIAANRVSRIYGILNGTCNYVLTEMEASGADFADVLARAQTLGYAEADPAFDVEGIDSAHKLAILAAMGFGAAIDFGSVVVRGIDEVRAADIAQAGALGFVIRLIGVADLEHSPGGGVALLQRVRPCLVSKHHPLAAVSGPTNAVVAEGDFAGRLLFQGQGAGAEPTASAVVADLIDLARGERMPPFSVPASELTSMPVADPGNRCGRDYLRFTVRDRPGVLAEITAATRDADVSIESLIQRGRAEDGGEVLVAMVTHDGPERCVTRALELLEGSASLTERPLVMPILKD